MAAGGDDDVTFAFPGLRPRPDRRPETWTTRLAYWGIRSMLQGKHDLDISIDGIREDNQAAPESRARCAARADVPVTAVRIFQHRARECHCCRIASAKLPVIVETARDVWGEI